jgi:ribosome biogenesis GTPase A
MAYQIIKNITKINPSILEDEYNIHIGDIHPYDVLSLIGKKRGCLMSGGRIDKERVSKIILKDYRKGNYGSLSLESPEMED